MVAGVDHRQAGYPDSDGIERDSDYSGNGSLAPGALGFPKSFES
jgi:hypothetical protein